MLPEAGPTSRVYFSQRLRLHYVDWGNPDAPPLILLHGGRDHCRNWDWVAADLRRDYHVIAPDLRGHGDSAWSASGHYTMANLIYDFAQLIHQPSCSARAITLSMPHDLSPRSRVGRRPGPKWSSNFHRPSVAWATLYWSPASTSTHRTNRRLDSM